MISKCPSAFFLLSLPALLLSTLPAAEARGLITKTVDPTDLVTLSGNTRAEASTGNDEGRVDDSLAMEHMLLQLRRSAAKEKALTTLIDQQHDSSSPNFHKWLTPEEFGKRFGSEPEDLATLKTWLTANGFTINMVHPSGMTIDFSGTAGQIRHAFHTEIHNLTVNGVKHVANVSDPQLPAALAPAVVGVVSMHNFRLHPMVRRRTQYTATSNGQTLHIVTPADLATIYDLNAAYAAGYTGQGQTIAVVEDTNLYSTADWNTFRATFGLTTYGGTLTTVHPGCRNPGVSSSGDDVEAALDAEWATAAAPAAAIQVVSCPATSATDGVTIATQNLVNSKTSPSIISISDGTCEALTGEAANVMTNSIYQQAVAQGISIFVAAGDEGSAGCDGHQSAATHGIAVNSNASTPYNVAVGGTDFADTYMGTSKTYWSKTNTPTYGSAISYIPEIPWNDSCASALLSSYNGYSVPYGTDGFCGSNFALNNGLLGVGGGSGGPSGCATGAPSVNLVVSGTCKGYPKPSWQMGIPGNPNDGVRDIPDISLFAADGIWGNVLVECFSDPNNGGAPCTGAPSNWFLAGGTSFSAPILAGIQALVNQKMGAAQGNPNPVYYKLATSSVASSVFHTISQGDISMNCSGTIDCFGIGFEGRGRNASFPQFVGNGALSTSGTTFIPAFSANGMWSFATGIGSVDGYNLIMNWSKGQ